MANNNYTHTHTIYTHVVLWYWPTNTQTHTHTEMHCIYSWYISCPVFVVVYLFCSFSHFYKSLSWVQHAEPRKRSPDPKKTNTLSQIFFENSEMMCSVSWEICACLLYVWPLIKSLNVKRSVRVQFVKQLMIRPLILLTMWLVSIIDFSSCD